MEINLVTPGEPRLIATPNRISAMVPTDGRLVILSVYGTTEAAPYLLRVVEAALGRIGPATTVSSYPLVPSVEQDSVFAP